MIYRNRLNPWNFYFHLHLLKPFIPRRKTLYEVGGKKREYTIAVFFKEDLE